ncbi:hypothetical protein PDO_5258 [Rhizobium sp. PDO1-076]|uniref:hypothetical protein n=1 Tax=Rhizobium sp. PDO1-076 TaxID=1125979 RepID=UPI00024E2B4A|nr:hypothetical protein [Rhizobium sp. PDO1-076]EHS51058.1 hypothetical protein PDO_5258 [Rhizobium sp. PDO1-076]
MGKPGSVSSNRASGSQPTGVPDAVDHQQGNFNGRRLNRQQSTSSFGAVSGDWDLPVAEVVPDWKNLPETNFPHPHKAWETLDPNEVPSFYDYETGDRSVDKERIRSGRVAWLVSKGVPKDEAEPCGEAGNIFKEKVISEQVYYKMRWDDDQRFIRHKWMLNSHLKFTGNTTEISVTLDLVPANLKLKRDDLTHFKEFMDAEGIGNLSSFRYLIAAPNNLWESIISFEEYLILETIYSTRIENNMDNETTMKFLRKKGLGYDLSDKLARHTEHLEHNIQCITRKFKGVVLEKCRMDFSNYAPVRARRVNGN